MRIGIFTERALTKKHGTGAQILRLLEGWEASFFHIYIEAGHGNVSDCANSFYLKGSEATDWRRRDKIKNAIANNLWGIWWPQPGNVNPRKFSRLLRERQLSCDVAYLVIGRETSARCCLSMLKHLNCPYVVHIMDLYHEELDPATMPGFSELLQGAAATIVITPPIAEQLAKFGIDNAHTIFIGQQAGVAHAQPPRPGEAVQIVMAGRPYAGGAVVLEQALPLIAAKYPNISFTYMGADFADHPPLLQKHIRNLGFISDPKEYQRILSQSHMAYLTGPSELNMFGRYSFPSRTSDYVMAGLPILACVAEGTATQQALRPLVPDAARFTRTPEQLLDALNYFMSSQQAWRCASEQAIDFGAARMSIDVVRKQVWTVLEQASHR